MTAPLSILKPEYEITAHKEYCAFANDVEVVAIDITTNDPSGDPVLVAQITATMFLPERFTDEIMDYLQKSAMEDPSMTNPLHLAILSIGGICLKYALDKPDRHPRAFIDLTVDLLRPEYEDLPLQEVMSKLKSLVQEHNPIVVYCSKESPVWEGHDFSNMAFEALNPTFTPNLFVARWFHAPIAAATPRLQVVA